MRVMNDRVMTEVSEEMDRKIGQKQSDEERPIQSFQD